MNLLNVLLKVLLADAAIKALSGKTGLSSSSLKKLLPLAIPLLLRYMTNNASSQSGALSLLGALTQHSNFRSAEEMLAEADEEDGGKIVKHILNPECCTFSNGSRLRSLKVCVRKGRQTRVFLSEGTQVFDDADQTSFQ